MTVVAKAILGQLGGNRFIVMTGAKTFTGGDNSLTFRLPSNFARAGINGVRVTLTPMDVYKVEFLKITGCKVSKVSEHDDVYAEGLQTLFTTETGLKTSLGTTGKEQA